MTLEAILTEIRDELKESNRIKAKQLQDFTDTAENPAGWTQMPAEEAAEDVEEKQQPKKAPAKKAAPKRKPEQPAEAESDGKDAAEQQEEPTETKEVEPNSNVPDEATFKKEIAKVIKGGTKQQKDKLKAKIKKAGASKVSEVPAESRQLILDYTESLHWLD